MPATLPFLKSKTTWDLGPFFNEKWAGLNMKSNQILDIDPHHFGLLLYLLLLQHLKEMNRFIHCSPGILGIAIRAVFFRNLWIEWSTP